MVDQCPTPKPSLLDRLSSRASKITAIVVLIGLFLASPLRPMTVFEHQDDKNHADSDQCQVLQKYYLQLMREKHAHETEHPDELLPDYLTSMIAINEIEAAKHNCSYKRN